MFAAAVLASVCSAGTAAAQDEISGTFTVKGVTTKFLHVYAYWKPNFFDATNQDLFVLFSDVPIPPDAIPKDDDGVGRIAGLVRDGKVHALELHLSPRDKRLDAAENAAVYHAGLAPARYGMSGMHVFQAKTFSPTLLEGSARTDGPQESDGTPWQYEVRFKVRIPPQPAAR